MAETTMSLPVGATWRVQAGECRRMPDGSQVGRSTPTVLLTLPNVITFGRLCVVPLAVWLVMEHRFGAAFFMFLAAGLSDAVDGWLARRNGGGNSVGALLDP
jgi:phosphatidylglycerophosphate synthase